MAPFLGDREVRQLSEHIRAKLLRLALRFSPGTHAMVALSEDLERRILAARMRFIERVQHDLPGAFAFYLASEYIHSQTILNNILYGKPRTDHPNAIERINQNIIHLLIEEDLLERIVELGMEFKVGTRGDRLSGGQRQKLAIARTLLKDPPIVILDEATAALDNASQKRIQNLVDTQWRARTTVIAVVHRLDIVKGYDKIAVMRAGKILEMGSYEDLMERKGMLYELVHGTKAGLL
jgi:ABC-type multidrug transport system fused ATPase/permease subunit